MAKLFHTNADCSPALHYMVDLHTRLEAVKAMVDQGQYFTINRARQYGKTTLLHALEQLLQEDYIVISLDFQMLGNADYENEYTFVEAFAGEISDLAAGMESCPEQVRHQLEAFAHGYERARLSKLFRCLSRWCGASTRKIVLMIDEADQAADHQVFLDFLSQLRGYYIQRQKKPSFWSVILAGVYDIRNMKRKFVKDSGYGVNSPWNIAADFLVELSFSAEDIEGMLADYEYDHHTGMDVRKIAQMLYEYTDGYPFLVSKLCKIIDEEAAQKPRDLDGECTWTPKDVLEAVNVLLLEKNSLFDSLTGKLQDYPELRSLLYAVLFYGQAITYNPDDGAIDMAVMLGFLKVKEGQAVIANRIFETRIYNYFLTAAQMQDTNTYKAALQDKNQFVINGHLDMRLVLEKFVVHFDELYGGRGQAFLEEEGRRFFLLYLRPIINGAGNYYIEARTRNMERTDVIVDYGGEQFVIEMKIWRGGAYHARGEKQLCDYLDYYHLEKGYMLSFNFNQKKETGVKEIHLGNRVLIEAVV